MTTDTASAPRRAFTAVRVALADLAAGRGLRAFYFAVLGAAWIGSSIAAEQWLGWHIAAAFAAVGLYELGGVTLAVFARRRRELGERAIPARLASVAFAAGAVTINLLGHTNHAGVITGPGYFFAGLSAGAYVVYLIEDAAVRRDALRAEGKLPEPPPVYGLYQWLRHPWLTRRARALAVTNAEIRLVEAITSSENGGTGIPTTRLLGRAASLAAAAAEIAAEKRLAAISTALSRRIAAGVDRHMAKIAVHTYDLGRVAKGIADDADYPALTGLLTAELTPGRIAAGVTSTRRRSWLGRRRETAETTVETAPKAVETTTRPALPAAPAAPAWPGAAPAGARLLRIIAAAPVAELPAPRTPADEPETAETDPVDTGDSTETDTSDPVDPPAPPLPSIEPRLLPHLAVVMTAHPDWYLTIHLHSKHPEALTGTKVKAAIGMTGQQLITDIRAALMSLSYYPDPEAAREYVLANAPAIA